MNPNNRAINDANELDEPGGTKDLALAIAAEVVFINLSLITVLCAGLDFGEANTGNLRFTVGDAGDVDIGYYHRVQPADLLSDKDAMLEAAVGELQARGDVTGRIDTSNVGSQAIINKNPTALHRNALLFESHVRCIWPTANGN